MIHGIFLALRDALKAKGVPFECVYGPTPVPPAVGGTSIQVLRDYDAGDSVAAPRGRFAGPTMVAIRSTGGLVRIHAMSTIGGARRGEHEDLADAIVDAVQAELHKIIRAIPTLYTVTRAGFVVDLQMPEGWQGVVYELHFSVDRGVRDTPWAAGASSQFVMTATTAQTALSATGAPATPADLPSATTRIDP